MTEAPQITPDFLIIPYVVKACRGLRPTDSDVYAVIYWYEKMKDGTCTASNQTIARVARCTERAVQGALQRLEQNLFIVCLYTDETKRVRTEIQTKVRYARVDSEPEKPTKKVANVPEKEEPAAEGEITPRKIAEDFFAPPGQVSEYRHAILQEMITQGYTKDFILSESKKFYDYWTELSSSGKKQRWQGEKYFDVKRRLYTWLKKSQEYTHNKVAKAGAGREI